MKDWKSSIAGILNFLTVTLTTISGLLAANTLSAGGGLDTIHVGTWVVIAINVALALCRAWLGIITQNADGPAVAKALNSVAQCGPAVTITTDDVTASPKA